MLDRMSQSTWIHTYLSQEQQQHMRGTLATQTAPFKYTGFGFIKIIGSKIQSVEMAEFASPDTSTLM